ncbi:unnamed protein product [Symbiodinium sp. CCMP2456]|nr:unnamed protein product [Symbiodinium sp. CCMP2456]
MKDMSVKKVHCRVILRHHSLLKDGPLPETPSTGSTSTCTTPASKDQKEDSSHVKRLVPCISDIDHFQQGRVLREEVGTGRVVLVPVWCLGWAQARVHSQMTFTSGDYKDRSVYELFHDLASGRLKPEDIEPLDVMVDGAKLLIMRGSRRGAMLSSLQGMCRHKTVFAPCRLFDRTDPRISNRLHALDSSFNGVGLQMHGHQPEAWHMNKPLFRSAWEWCDEADARGNGQVGHPALQAPRSDSVREYTDRRSAEAVPAARTSAEKLRLGAQDSVSWHRKELKTEAEEELRKADLPLVTYDGGPKGNANEKGGM